jgi:hypothetical protein
MDLIKHLIYRIFKAKGSGLLKIDPEDVKDDFDLGSIFSFFGSYTPQVNEKKIETLSTKDQKSLSNCSFQAATVQKEVDEGVVLSARYLTAKAYQQGLCGFGGWADLKAGQTIMQKFGICEEKDCPSNSNLSFKDYVNIDFTKLDPLAEKHKSKSFWIIRSIDDALKAVDEGHIVTIGMPWYSGFNQGGGFKAPWIITKLIGYFISGHALAKVGFLNDKKLSDVQNSYSDKWGDNGHLYIDYSFLNKYIKQYGAYANLDIEYDKISASDIVSKYDLKNVRGTTSGAIYLIYNGNKMPYKNARAFIAYNGLPYFYKDMFTIVPQEELDKIKTPSDGGLLTAESSNGKYSKVALALKSPVNENFNK